MPQSINSTAQTARPAICQVVYGASGKAMPGCISGTPSDTPAGWAPNTGAPTIGAPMPMSSAGSRGEVFVEHGRHRRAGPAPSIVAASSPSVSRAITCEPLSDSSVSVVSSNGVSRKSSSVFTWAGELPPASPGASMSSSPSSNDSSPPPPRSNGCSSDRPLSAGSTREMPLSLPIVTSLPLSLPPSTRSSSSSPLPLRSMADPPHVQAAGRRLAGQRGGAVLQRQVFLQGQIQFLELSDLGVDLVFVFLLRPGVGAVEGVAISMSLPANWMSLSPMAGSRRVHGDHRARGSHPGLAQGNLAQQHVAAGLFLGRNRLLRRGLLWPWRRSLPP